MSSQIASATARRLALLRDVMRKFNLHAYVIPSQDAHQSEYVAEFDKRRAYMTNFTGSAGTAVVTLKDALVWTDGRYWNQCQTQIKDTEWKLMRMTRDDPMEKWLAENLEPQSNIGLDPFLISAAEFKRQKAHFDALTKQIQLVPVLPNLVDQIWTNKPAPPHGKIFPLPVEISGEDHRDKIERIRASMRESNIDGLIITALDEIAWLFNLRGSDVSFNPVFWSYAYLTHDKVFLYVDETKFTDDSVAKHLGDFVTIRPYGDSGDIFVNDIQSNPDLRGKIICIDPSSCNYAIYSAVEKAQASIVHKNSPVALAKSIKNQTELEGIKQAHLVDAVALVRFFAWLEEAIQDNSQVLTEVSVADKLEQFRSEGKNFVSLSFDTISSVGANAAVIHYKPEPETCATLTRNDLFLLDSGAQYLNGTTDVTRTMHLGTPTQHQRESFTRVLKGHITLDTVKFPRGTTGYKLDILARTPLWEAGLDYRHGTGHGVGAFLNVHEGPHGIGTRPSANEFPLKPGMTVTNEPGYYEDGNFGIRIENIMIVKEAQTKFNFGATDNTPNYLEFEHVTFVPIQARMIDTSLLSQREIDWVNKYHAECYEKLAPFFAGSDRDIDQKALAWLKENTKPIQ